MKTIFRIGMLNFGYTLLISNNYSVNTNNFNTFLMQYNQQYTTKDDVLNKYRDINALRSVLF